MNAKAILMTTLPLLTLCSCASEQEFNAKPPAQVYRSDKSLGALEECLAQGFTWAGRATVIHGDGHTIIDYGNMTPILTFKIFEQDGHRIIEQRHLHKVGGEWRRHIQECVS